MFYNKISANQITIIALIIGLISALSIFLSGILIWKTQLIIIAATLMLISFFFDALDGALARLVKPTVLIIGGFLYKQYAPPGRLVKKARNLRTIIFSVHKGLIIPFLVTLTGLEPARSYRALGPQPKVSTYSTTESLMYTINGGVTQLVQFF